MTPPSGGHDAIGDLEIMDTPAHAPSPSTRNSGFCVVLVQILFSLV